ncbi:Vitamin K epoxide reductase family protein [Legionella santicrucis]|uniref:Vitamin K epoxide reductase family protein n=1 Tax=Legionella santicrucis TaxID=45074 RepID=A0A0W0YK16_9GAMM|nr:vitamin K epoxide reductase family protein [Legionella santicrucis]KTD57039.1 Vitamin K epoxide reductase family protein [Legionella santicrucis]
MPNHKKKPLVVITGALGNLGVAITGALKEKYQVVGFDKEGTDCDIPFDITSDSSVSQSFNLFKKRFGNQIAAVIHLAAYFDFSGEVSPLYEKVNEQGTKNLLNALQEFTVERFIFSSTMLVHKAGNPGETINEETPLAPKWIYPESKKKTEKIIQKHHGKIPYLILRLAGLYDDKTCIPTLAHQIARTYERKLKSNVYAGNPKAGQSFIHQDDLVRLFAKAVHYRQDLAEEEIILAGEAATVSYEKLQKMITELLHDEKMELFNIPRPVAKAASWVEEKSESIIPNDFDQGEKPFIRPFMIDLGSDHYELDIAKAREKLHWRPSHHIEEIVPKIINELKKDPKNWYKNNGITLPDWMEVLEEKNPEIIRERYEFEFRKAQQQNLWGHFFNFALAFWLLTSPFILGYRSNPLIVSDMFTGILLACGSLLSLSWRLAPLRWGLAFLGVWLIFAPLIFWSPTAIAYLNDTLIGALMIGFSVLIRPNVGIAPNAALTGPIIPPGWDFSPSSWVQRIPIIILAFIGFYISRYMAAYQLGHIDFVWDPFFTGNPQNPKNGTEEIITSYLSKKWPISDAGFGAVVYLFEILTGVIGGTNRWRTMPWVVLLFGLMVIPLGAVSITFIIIQPIFLNTYCTLCLIAAVVMLIQMAYSADEIIATLMFLWRRWQKGRPLLRILFVGDTDEEYKKGKDESLDDFEQAPGTTLRVMWSKGITLPWNLLLCLFIGLWLMFSRLILNASGGMANMNHLLGALIITVTIISFAEVARAIRYINWLFALTLIIISFIPFISFIYHASLIQIISNICCGILLFFLTIPRGKIEASYGKWDNFIV